MTIRRDALGPSAGPQRLAARPRPAGCTLRRALALTAFLALPATVRALDCAAVDLDAGVPPGFRSKFADVGDVRLHYVIGGQGPALLLVHGWPETWFAWRRVMPALARHHTVVAVDYRGAGQSSAPASGYERKTMAEDLHALAVQLGLRRVVLVGHDWGASVAYAYAAQHRDEVSHVVALEGRPDGPWNTTREPYWFFGFQGIPDFAERVLVGHEAEYLDWFYRTPGFHVVPFEESQIALYECTFSRPGRMRAGFQLYRTIDADIRDNAQLARVPLDVPVLAIGARHGVGPRVADAMHAVARHVTPVLMEETGHFVPDERPQELVGLLERFLRGEPVPARWTPELGAGPARSATR